VCVCVYVCVYINTYKIFYRYDLSKTSSHGNCLLLACLLAILNATGLSALLSGVVWMCTRPLPGVLLIVISVTADLNNTSDNYFTILTWIGCVALAAGAYVSFFFANFFLATTLTPTYKISHTVRRPRVFACVSHVIGIRYEDFVFAACASCLSCCVFFLLAVCASVLSLAPRLSLAASICIPLFFFFPFSQYVRLSCRLHRSCRLLHQFVSPSLVCLSVCEYGCDILLQCQKRPYSVKRDLLQCQKRPTSMRTDVGYAVDSVSPLVQFYFTQGEEEEEVATAKPREFA